jgi:23S rRNA pseudoU1915 N3-methylase RlmH
MGNAQSSAQKINYEDIQYVLKNPESHVLINTLHENEQTCLIPNTIHINQEEEIINRLIKNGNKNVKIIIYGKNCNDEKLYKKYSQLISLGFHSVYIYTGGMFEWLLLQDIYSSSEFPTTKKELDLLLFKPPKVLTVCLLEYH